jgi:class 3 adenylate cyclase/TolB-like protein/Flp pilus assembly protein TadD
MVATTVFVDVAESVRLLQRDEAGSIARWRSLVGAIVERLLPKFGGRLVKSLGDGLMLCFAVPQDAVAAALAIRVEATARNAELPLDARFELRMGAHHGEQVLGEFDLYGHSINLAARVLTLAGPGEIVITADLRHLITDGIDAELEDLGDCWIRHLERPVRAYRVGPAGSAPIIDPADSALSVRPTIAVVPMSARSAPARLSLLGDVIADAVIAALSRQRQLDVISRLSTSALRDRSETLRELCVRMGANYVLSGSFNASGSKVMLALELSEAEGGRVVWVERISASSRALLWGDDPAIDRIVESVSSALVSHEVRRSQRKAMPTMDSFTLMLSAITLMHRLSLTEFNRAGAMLESLVERAPRLAEPHAWLAKWHVLRMHQGWSQDPDRDTASAEMRIARALDTDSHCTLALTFDGLVQTQMRRRLDLAEQRFEQALELNPSESLAWLLLGTLKAFRAEGSEAVQATAKALRLSPIDPLRDYYDSLAATAACSAEDFEGAIRHARRSLRANRAHASTWRALAVSLSLAGHLDEARAAVAQLLALQPGFTVSRWLSRAPFEGSPVARVWSEALRKAGAPH